MQLLKISNIACRYVKKNCRKQMQFSDKKVNHAFLYAERFCLILLSRSQRFKRDTLQNLEELIENETLLAFGTFFIF